MNIYALIIGVLFVYACLWFAISIVLKRNDIADIAWGFGFILVALISFYFGDGGDYLKSQIVTLLVILWGFRLSSHIYYRNKGKKEDFRYKKWRDEWGSWFYLRSFLQVYLLQMGFLFLIASSFIYINLNPVNNLNILDVMGILIWLIGFIFELAGDYQLLKFKQNPKNKGKIMKLGVWRYTRHPNYFGEVTQWWGIWLMALSHVGGWITIISPITITLLILGVSGIPMLEKKYQGNKDYEKYKQETSAFFPWFYKKSQ